MFPIDSSYLFHIPITYYGSDDANDEFEEDDDAEFLLPAEELDLSQPKQKITGIHLHWFNS